MKVFYVYAPEDCFGKGIKTKRATFCEDNATFSEKKLKYNREHDKEWVLVEKKHIDPLFEVLNSVDVYFHVNEAFAKSKRHEVIDAVKQALATCRTQGEE